MAQVAFPLKSAESMNPLSAVGGTPMKIRIPGVGGDIGAQARTTSLLADRDMLIDAGRTYAPEATLNALQRHLLESLTKRN